LRGAAPYLGYLAGGGEHTHSHPLAQQIGHIRVLAVERGRGGGRREERRERRKGRDGRGEMDGRKNHYSAIYNDKL
jgi:hypothetical protein